MKKVLKLILVFAVIAALTVSVFAASPTERDVDENSSGAAEITAATTDAPLDIIVRILPPNAERDAQNKAKAESDGTVDAYLDSFDVVVTRGDEVLHSGVNVNITFSMPADSMGKTFTVYENTDGNIRVAYSAAISSSSVTVTLSSFSTFTPAIMGQPQQTSTSPQTSQSMLPIALGCIAVLALAGVVVSTKRRFN